MKHTLIFLFVFACAVCHAQLNPQTSHYIDSIMNATYKATGTDTFFIMGFSVFVTNFSSFQNYTKV